MDGLLDFKSESEKEREEFEEALERFSVDSDSILVARYNENRERVQLPSIKNVPLSNIEALFDEIRNRYMADMKEGKFFVQIRNKSGFSKGSNVLIGNPLLNKKEDRRDDLEKKVDSLFNIISNQQNQKSSSREDILKEMAVMKEILGSSQSQAVDMSKVYLDMSKAMREGFQLGREFNLPEKKEDDNSTKWIPMIAQFLPMLFQKEKNEVKTVQTGFTPVVEPQILNRNGDEEMKIQYLSLIPKIKKAALIKNQEEQNQKVETLGNDLIDFYPEIIQYIELVKSDDAIESLIAQYGIIISEDEKKVCKKIIAFIKENITDDSETQNG